MTLQEEDLGAITIAAELIAPYSHSATVIIAQAMHETATYCLGHGAQAYKDWLAAFTTLGEIIIAIAQKKRRTITSCIRRWRKPYDTA